jgi:hypothetical protein
MMSSPSRTTSRDFSKNQRKASGDTKADVSVAATALWGTAVGGDLGAVRADLEEEASLVCRLACSQVLDLDRGRGNSLCSSEDFDLDQMGASDLSARRQPANDVEIAKRQFAHDSG